MQEEIIEGYRLSPQQRRVWALQESAGGAAFCAQCAVLIEGPLDLAAFNAALEDLINRHSILRTTFQCFYGMTVPVQVIADARLRLDGEYDLCGLDQQEQAERIQEVLCEARAAGFDNGPGSALRGWLMRLSEDNHTLIMSLPALCADSVGLRNMVREISRGYANIVSGRQESGDEPLQYIAASQWQNDLFDSEDFELGKAFWSRLDLSSLSEQRLPLGKRPSASDRFDPKRVSFFISRETMAGAEAVAERSGVRVSDFLLSCWVVLVGRLSGQKELSVGVCYDGRRDDETRGALGPFAKYLPVRARMGEEATFRQVLEEVSETVREVSAWQEWFDWERLTGEEDEAGSRYLRVIFDYEEEAERVGEGGINYKVIEQEVSLERYEIRLSCKEREEGMRVEVGYNARVYEEGEIRRVGKQYEKMLGRVVERPEEKLRDIEVLTEEEQQQIEEYNKTSREYEVGGSIQGRIERQVEERGDAVAVVYEGESVSYEELNRRANKLAHYLRREGVKPESLVAICAERSPEMVVGLLGILKSGAGYEPMDPTYPPERLAFMLQDSGAEVLLTQEKLLGSFTGQKIKKICLDKNQEDVCKESEDNVASGTAPENVAYVIYTSGSTGKPKGVIIEHRSPVNLMAALRQAIYAEQAGDTFLISLNAPLAFDASVQQLIMLMRGDTLHIIPQAIRADGKSLLSYLAANRVDIFDCTPSQLATLLEAGLLDSEAFSPQAVLVAGEAIDENMWRDLASARHTKFYNIYGPTECTVDATFCRVKDSPDRPNIGRPLANYQVHVTAACLKRAPIGVSGELCIGGAGLARGYLNRPDLTAEKFIPDPFSDVAGNRLYKTGDVGRHTPSGAIEFLGRLDNQIKIRGYRVELEEIESVLNQHPSIREAVVIARKDEQTSSRLWGYVTSYNQQPLQVTELMNYARTKLPEYMVPATLITLEAFPLNSSGKVDRNALPLAAPPTLKCVEEMDSPKTLTEEVVSGIWKRLLAVERVGRYDNFFSLGGHSLLVTQVISRVRHSLNVELPLGTLFESPTLASFAEAIDSTLDGGVHSPAPRIEPAGRADHYPLSYGQLHLWRREQAMTGGSGSYVYGGWRQRGEGFNFAAMEQGLSEVVRRHEALRTRFPVMGGEPVQVIDEHVAMGLPIVDLCGLSGSQRRAQMRISSIANARRGFDLRRGPVIRARLIVTGSEERVLQYCMHHIVADGQSVDVIDEELRRLYESNVRGEGSELEELRLQYRDYAVWQREYLSGEVLDKQLEYWKGELEGATERVKVESDRERPKERTYRGGWQHLRVSREVSERLEEISVEQEATLYMTLLSIYVALLASRSGQKEVVVGSPVTFRDREEIEGLVGYFTNVVVLRVKLEGARSYEEVLRGVRGVTLGAYRHQEMAYEILEEEMRGGRGEEPFPLFHVWFNFIKKSQQSYDDSEHTTGLLNVEEIENNTASFDISLVIKQQASGLRISMEYNKDLFDTERVRGMLSEFESLIERVIADPAATILDIPMFAGPKASAYQGDWDGLREVNAGD